MKECVASMARPLPKASLHAERDAARSLGESRRIRSPGESHASSSVLLISFEMLAITTNEAMRAERREFSRGAKIRFHRSPQRFRQ